VNTVGLIDSRDDTGDTEAEPPFLTPADTMALLDQAARRYLYMSGAEFIERWDRGDFPDPDRPDVMRVLVYLPLVRAGR
jgi:hypothetical protein